MSARAQSAFGGDIKAVLGPTNTGKTHLAIERMLGHASGAIGLPLRLLAREVYDRVVAAKGEGAAALITGEEKIAPETARYFICTVEAMPLDRVVEFLAVDEIQVARDPDRGHVFTERLLNARGMSETMLLGSDTMRPMVRKLLPKAEIIRRERMSTLSYAGPKKITKLPKRSAVVAFSAEEVYAIAELLRRHRGGAAVVMGALSPRTRNAQVELYQSGEVDFLVATDAIGMGLNMDVDHVAFASRRKFDGHAWRDLRADEIAQIAGRAGRFTTDGAFGETGECAPFDGELVERVEAHDFEPVDAIHWRSAALRFDSIEALLASLDAPTPGPGLVRVRGADDEDVLHRLVEDHELRALVRTPAEVKRLWELCQLPDFRKITPEEHARLVGRIAHHALSDRGRAPGEWVRAELDQLDRPQGDLDALHMRLAHVRTWTYAASRPDWLEDAEHFRARAREVEDKLSDALHEALTQRFIDRRTSALLKGLKREDALLAGISSEGEVSVEGHYVGRLDGLAFKPDPRAAGLEGRAVRNAAIRALKPEVSRRLRRIAAAEDGEITLSRDGRLRVDNAAVARLCSGAPVLKPKLDLIGGDTASETERSAARERLEFWLARKLAADLRPLLALEAAWREGRLPADARGLAFRLIESAGALDPAGEDIAHLTAAGRKALERLGVRIGRHGVFMPALVRPRAAQTLALLHHVVDAEHARRPLFLPKPGALSALLDRPCDWNECAAAGYRACGRVAVRFDVLDRLGEALARETPPDDAALSRLIGRPKREVAGVLSALGYRRAAPAEEGAPAPWRFAPRKPKRQTKRAAAKRDESPFAALAELLPEPGPRRRRGGRR